MDGGSVLVVDDVTDVRELLSFTLEEEGYDVLQACNGQEALEVAKVHELAVIVMDVQMPVMDGIEATRQLKSEGALRHIPVIAYTAYGGGLSGSDLFAAILPKPCSPDEVLGAVARSRARGAKKKGG